MKRYAAPALVGALSFAATAWGQVAPAPPPPLASAKAPTFGFLSDDKRLSIVLPASAQLLDGPERRTRVGFLFSKISKATRVSLSSDFEGIEQHYRFVAFDKATAAELMDAIAAIHLLRWQQTSPSTYRLIGPANETDFFLPNDDNAREKHAAGMALMAGIDALPKNIADQITAGTKVNVSDLSPDMRQNLMRVIAATDKVSATFDGYTPFPMERLPQATFYVETKPHKAQGFTAWFIHARIEDAVAMGTEINDYAEQKSKRSKDADKDIYAVTRSDIDGKQARAIPALHRAVHFSKPDVTLTEVLQALQVQYHFNIITDTPDLRQKRAAVTLDAETLPDAFDQLATLFPGMQWEYRPSRFFVVRSHYNWSNTAGTTTRQTN